MQHRLKGITQATIISTVVGFLLAGFIIYDHIQPTPTNKPLNSIILVDDNNSPVDTLQFQYNAQMVYDSITVGQSKSPNEYTKMEARQLFFHHNPEFLVWLVLITIMIAIATGILPQLVSRLLLLRSVFKISTKSIVLILLPFLSHGQDNQNRLGLSEKQYKLYIEGFERVRRDPKAAIVIYDSLLKEKPNFCKAIIGLAYAYYHDHNLQSSKYYFKRGLLCYPNKPLCYHQLSQIYREEEEYDSAEYILLEYIENQEGDLDNLITEYTELGKITRAKNQYHKSVEYLTEAINRYTDEYKDLNSYAELYFLRADSYSTIDEPEKAWKDILEFEKLKPGDMRALALGGDILQDMGKYEESNKVLFDYLKNPTNLGENWVNYLIGINYYVLNEKELACKHFKIAKALGYDNPILMEYLKECD